MKKKEGLAPGRYCSVGGRVFRLRIRGHRPISFYVAYKRPRTTHQCTACSFVAGDDHRHRRCFGCRWVAARQGEARCEIRSARKPTTPFTSPKAGYRGEAEAGGGSPFVFRSIRGGVPAFNYGLAPRQKRQPWYVLGKFSAA